MARIFSIQQIEGNSNLGNPVFSNYAKMQNFQYLAFSPIKDDLFPHLTHKPNSVPVEMDNLQFKFGVETGQTP
jgi:hypothetical protein